LTRGKQSFSGKIESEIALIIKDRPLQNARKIANLSSMLDYALTRRRSSTIHDTYFDTDSKYFTRNLISFRVRRYSHEVILSAKSSPQELVGGGTSRLEIERPWSHESLVRITRKLGLEPPSRELFERSAGSSSRVLAAAGLEIIQNRLTRRKSRDLVAFRRGKPFRFAEMSIDDVTYTLAQGKVRLLEVEIEAKATRALPKIRRVVKYLLSEYPSLQVWAHGKFVTGMAIMRLLRKRNLSDLTRERLLRPGVFGLIDRTARARSR
jgi:CYTH domain-containing protein